MVRLKSSSTMSVLQGVTISCEGHAEAETWIAVLKHTIAIDSTDPFYDGFFYKDQVMLQDLGGTELRLELSIHRGHVKNFLVKFVSEVVKRQFLRLMTLRYDDGLPARLPSPAWSATPSPNALNLYYVTKNK